MLRRLFPEPGDITPEELISGLGLGDLAPPERPYLVLNMVSSLDGKAAVQGKTAALGSEADRTIFHHLRTQADAVMIGAGTVNAEGYGRTVKSPELREKRVREGLTPDPLAVVVSSRLSVRLEVPLLQEPEQRVVIATGSDDSLEGVSSQVSYLRIGDDLPLLMTRLREDHGVRSVLCEGGPTLNDSLLAAGLVDELFLTMSARLVGGAHALTIVAGRALVDPRDARLEWLCAGAGDLFTRWTIE